MATSDVVKAKSQGEGQGYKVWSRGASRTRPGREDYASGSYTTAKKMVTCLAVSTEYRHVTEGQADRQTDRQTDRRTNIHLATA